MDTFFALWADEPFVVLGFLASLLVGGFYLAMGAKVRIRHRPGSYLSLLESERTALLAEKDREHARRVMHLAHRDRAANLRLVADRMSDDHEQDVA